MEFFKTWQQAQKAWLDGCIELYGKMLEGAEKVLDMSKEHHEAVKKHVEQSRRDE